MQRIGWGYVLGIFALLGLLVGCNGGEGAEPVGLLESASLEEQCEMACNRVYDGCGLFMMHPTNGAGVSKRTCQERCENNEFRGYEACVAEASCGESVEDMVLGCFPEGMQAEYCEHLGLWPQELEAAEERVVELVNEVRAAGATCGSAGSFAPAGPVEMDEVLRCAARLHSIDMEERGFFDHDNPDGESPFDRIDAAGYAGGSPQGENIAQGYPTPEAVMEGWMSSDGHCSNIMEPGFKEIGVGLYERQWTQKFGGGGGR